MMSETKQPTMSRRAREAQPFRAMVFGERADEMIARSISVIKLSLGEPDFGAPPAVRDAMREQYDGRALPYTAALGLPELRRAIADSYHERHHVDIDPRRIVITAGGSAALLLATALTVDPGDEVILPAPYWVSYYELIKMVGGVPVVVTTTEENGFNLTPEQLQAAITPKTKALMLNSPSNPTGMIYSREHLEDIAKVCLDNDLYVIADEMYSKLVFDNKEFVSFPTLSKEIKARTILVGGASKTYAMTGWRIGFAAASKEIVQVMSNYLSHSLSGTCSIAQAAATEAFSGSQDEIEVMRQAFETRRNYLYERMSAIPGVHPVRPEATFYMLMNLDQLIGKTLYGDVIHDADDFARVFLREGLVAVVPCTGFGAPNYVRWSFAVSMENIKEGMDRLEKFLKNA